MLYVAIGLFVGGAMMLLGLGRYPDFRAAGEQIDPAGAV
jgi:hypothetical protein